MTAATHTCQQALEAAHGLGIARLDAQLLLLQVLQRPDTDRAWLLAHDEQPLTPAQATAYQTLLQRRAAGEPVAYLVGRKEFFGLDLRVDSRVLVPRPDTETLVTWALDTLAAVDPGTEISVLDLGTGSGAVALAIAQQARASQRSLHMVAVDVSAGALAVAAANADRLGLDIMLVHSHWFARVEGRFQLIVSNPPYIAEDDPHLAALAHEPRQALTAGVDGLDDVRHIIAQAPSHLHPGGWLLLEHGYNQAAAVRALLSQAGFVGVTHRQDLAGVARCSGGQWAGC